MLLVLANPDDREALWLRTALVSLVDMPVEVLTPTRLICARSITHRLPSTSGGFRFEFADGGVLLAGEVAGLVNRMTTMPTAHLEFAAPVDRAYAEAELHAFLLGWLGSLACPMLNPPAPESLAGAWHSEVAALHLATLAGLNCAVASVDADAPFLPARTPAQMVHFVLDGKVIGPILPAGDRDALLQFGHLWGTRLLQVETARQGGKLTFVSASALPHYSLGGRALVRAMAEVLSA
ncbi:MULTISPECIES: hypothetical protein [unclassified Ensifer]|uniref:hypothetical protein n=1 Tax=unclassified Ensifer TaxID=2633371 RepID=UPI0008135DD4|nr:MULTISPECIES: hypothetical protein [unclassified Ensifer]OCP00659.1 hypothetical protein BC362_03285 [Ensifer sp. LC14]OCP07791.1 hypothetical protein BBX50_20765 [Ensifer sp. LC11]OCP08555.1 hypothetical protein BC374_20980 [Ensifer sp. LC13]OCP32153.1 hypothetical protein BC364_20710 [Ensifer sp. LC499]